LETGARVFGVAVEKDRGALASKDDGAFAGTAHRAIDIGLGIHVGCVHRRVYARFLRVAVDGTVRDWSRRRTARQAVIFTRFVADAA